MSVLSIGKSELRGKFRVEVYNRLKEMGVGVAIIGALSVGTMALQAHDWIWFVSSHWIGKA